MEICVAAIQLISTTAKPATICSYHVCISYYGSNSLKINRGNSILCFINKENKAAEPSHLRVRRHCSIGGNIILFCFTGIVSMKANVCNLNCSWFSKWNWSLLMRALKWTYWVIFIALLQQGPKWNCRLTAGSNQSRLNLIDFNFSCIDNYNPLIPTFIPTTKTHFCL